VPEGWDTSRPPGVRVKTGNYQMPPDSDFWKWGWDPEKHRNIGKGERDAGTVTFEAKDIRDRTITAPSTPDAARFDGLRGSVAPLKPFAYPILHAQKPREGSYLANLRAHGVGAWNVEEARVPFDEGQGSGVAPWGKSTRRTSREWAPGSALHDCDMEPIPAHSAGRSPSNLLSYADLLGDLQRYCDLDAWCERLGLPDAAADLLEAGLVYAPKPSRAEKEAGLEGFAEKPAGGLLGRNAENNAGKLGPTVVSRNTHPTAKPAALCAYLVALATREGQTVLDPFCGSGSTGVACARIGRNFVGVELDADFAAIARARIAHAETTRPAQEALPL
ncbi:MAG TPA: site-specific DNA-methyltransferase, partial [Aggregatilineales bacterium]|nr:site-specific DNA-methyltransferase [Aggregatilineales bacterium]